MIGEGGEAGGVKVVGWVLHAEMFSERERKGSDL